MLIWRATDACGCDYQVRRAGNSLRLYTDGVFHTQYNSSRRYERAVWDLLWLPVSGLALGSRPRVLVLGVGGGAVIHKLRREYPHALLVGVDLNPVHLRVAREVFAVNHPDDLLLEAEASAFVHAYRGPAFDVVVDDVFAEREGEPVRAIPLDDSWCRLLLRILTPHGLLIGNFASARELSHSAPWQECRSDFAERWRWRMPGYDNVIGACYRSPDVNLARLQREAHGCGARYRRG